MTTEELKRSIREADPDATTAFLRKGFRSDQAIKSAVDIIELLQKLVIELEAKAKTDAEKIGKLEARIEAARLDLVSAKHDIETAEHDLEGDTNSTG